MAHTSFQFARRTLAVSAALAFALSVAPGVALADTYTAAPVTVPDVEVQTGAETGSLTIQGLEPGDTVTAYRFVTATYTPASNSLETSLAMDNYGFTLEELSKADDSGVKDYASDVMQNLGSTEPYKSGEANEHGVATISNLPFGEYLLAVTHGDNASTVVYQHTIVNFVPTTVDDKSGYYFDQDQSVNVKREDIGESFTDGQTGKKVKNDGTWAELSDDYATGEWAQFKIEALVPAYDDDAPVNNKTFEITDVFPDQLKGIRSLKVTLETEDGADVTNLVGVSSYDTDSTGFTVNMGGSYFSAVAKATKVVITFEAQVQDNLTPNIAYTNNATLTFSTNPWVSDDGGSATDGAQVKNYGAFIKKVDENGAALSGATFKLTKQGETDPVENALVSDANGYVWATGLDEGTYTFTETKAPDGYTLAENAISTNEVNAANSTDTADLAGEAVDFDSNAVDFGIITNAKATLGSQLPTTGGAGTIAFTAAGVVIIAGAAAFIVRSRKNSDNA